MSPYCQWYVDALDSRIARSSEFEDITGLSGGFGGWWLRAGTVPLVAIVYVVSKCIYFLFFLFEHECLVTELRTRLFGSRK